MNKIISLREVPYLVLPLLLGYLASSFCLVGKSSGSILKFRPPPYVFRVIWPILFLAVGYSFVLTIRDNKCKSHLIPFISLSILLALWIIVYGCMKDKRSAVWIILLSILAGIHCVLVSPPGLAQHLMCPLIVWLLFALLMNALEVQLSK